MTDVECAEGASAEFHCQFAPTNDNSLRIEWIRNGEPVMVRLSALHCRREQMHKSKHAFEYLFDCSKTIRCIEIS